MALALPEHTEGERVRYLQDILDGVEMHVAISDWPKLEKEDVLLIGRLVYLFNFVEVNLRRLVESWEEHGLLRVKINGRAKDLHIGVVDTIVQEMFPWPEKELECLKQLAYFRTVRNLVAHFAVKRFPDDDGFLFIAKSERDFRRQFPDTESASNMMMTAVLDGAQLRDALEEVERLQSWLASVTSELVRQAYHHKRV
jgi:hypothetical protein